MSSYAPHTPTGIVIYTRLKRYKKCLFLGSGISGQFNEVGHYCGLRAQILTSIRTPESKFMTVLIVLSIDMPSKTMRFS